MLHDRLSELLPLQCIVYHFADQALGDAGCNGGDMQASLVQHAHRHFEAFALARDHVLGRHTRIFEDHITDMRALLAHFLFRNAHRYARCIALHNEGRNALRAGRIWIRPRHDRKKVCLVRIGDVALGAIQHVMVAITDGLGRQAASVRPRFRLGQREAGDQVARGNTRQPSFLLRIRSEQDERLAADADIRARHATESRGCLAQLHRNQCLGLHIQGQTAILFRHRDAEQAEILHLVDDFLWYFVFLADLGLDRHALFGHKAADLLDQRRADFGIECHTISSGEYSCQTNLCPNGTLVEG